MDVRGPARSSVSRVYTFLSSSGTTQGYHDYTAQTTVSRSELYTLLLHNIWLTHIGNENNQLFMHFAQFLMLACEKSKFVLDHVFTLRWQKCRTSHLLSSMCFGPCPSNRMCASECPRGFWGDRRRCKRCYSSCESCTGSRSDQCTSCQPGHHLIEGTSSCTAVCGENHYLDHGWISVLKAAFMSSRVSHFLQLCLKRCRGNPRVRL